MEIFNSTLYINSLVASMYLLARIFKNFDNQDQSLIDQPSKAHNIIIYAGDKHSELCRKFLNKNIDFKQIADSGIKEIIPGDNMHCLNMKTIQQPFFSEWLFNTKKIGLLYDLQDSVELNNSINNFDISFIMPHQLNLIKNNNFDLTIAIDCVHEMDKKTIQNYFTNINNISKLFNFVWSIST